MGKFDLDQHWPFPPYQGRADGHVADALPEPLPDGTRDAPEAPYSDRDEGALARALSEALASRDGRDDPAVTAENSFETPTEPRPAFTRSKIPYVWGGLGFAAGIVASHVIGFWSFVSNVVVHGHDNDRGSRTVTATASRPASRSEVAQKVVVTPPAAAWGGAEAAPGRCIALSIDRAQGETHLVSCEAQEHALRDAGFRRRGDLAAARPRLQDPAAWSNTTAVQSEIETGTLQESDVDLSLDR